MRLFPLMLGLAICASALGCDPAASQPAPASQPTAAGEESRTPIAMPAAIRQQFLEHMRHHMDALDDVMVELARGDFKAAAQVARDQLVSGSGAGFGRFLPLEFREMGLGMHRAAAVFADVADAIPAEPSAADWQKAIEALQAISAHCRACHASFHIP